MPPKSLPTQEETAGWRERQDNELELISIGSAPGRPSTIEYRRQFVGAGAGLLQMGRDRLRSYAGYAAPEPDWTLHLGDLRLMRLRAAGIDRPKPPEVQFNDRTIALGAPQFQQVATLVMGALCFVFKSQMEGLIFRPRDNNVADLDRGLGQLEARRAPRGLQVERYRDAFASDKEVFPLELLSNVEFRWEHPDLMYVTIWVASSDRVDTHAVKSGRAGLSLVSRLAYEFNQY